MNFEGHGEINKFELCERASSQGEDIQELSIALNFRDDVAKELIGGDKTLPLLDNDEMKSFTMGKGSEILSEVFNLNINGYVFKGEKFTSCEVKKSDEGSHITILRCRVKFIEDFYNNVPGKMFRKVIPISIVSVQGELPLVEVETVEDPGEEVDEMDPLTDESGLEVENDSDIEGSGEQEEE